MVVLRCSLTLVPLLVVCLAVQALDQREEWRQPQEAQKSGTDGDPMGRRHGDAIEEDQEEDRRTILGGRSAKQHLQGNIQSRTFIDKHSQINIQDATIMDNNSQINIQDATIMNNNSLENNHMITGKNQLPQEHSHDTVLSWETSNTHAANNQELNQKVLNQHLNQEDLNQQHLNQQTLNLEYLNQQHLSQQNLNQQDLNQQHLNQEDLNLEYLNQQEISQQNLNQQDLSQQNLNENKLRSSPLLEHIPLVAWDVSYDSLQRAEMIPRCKLTHNDTRAICAHHNLTVVPSDGIPHIISYFDLHDNFISKLSNYTFANYTQLKYLDLSRNNISELEELAFYGLDQLQFLNLWGNRLRMFYSTFSATVFSSMFRLEKLIINKNIEDCKNTTGLTYPDKALSSLTSLKSLFMDGLSDADFGPGFQNLTNLVNLSMVGYVSGCCHLHSLPNGTFRHLSHIQYLNISSCFITGKLIEPGAFSNLQNLTVLDMTHNEDIDIQNLDNVFHGLSQIPSLKVLRMNLIVNRYSIGICLDNFFIRNFPPHLEYFEAQENNIEGLDRQVLRTLSPSLKTLDVSGNKFVFGTYLLDLHLMTNLTELKLNGGSFIYSLPKQYPFHISGEIYASNCTLYGINKGEVVKPFILKLPPNLRSVEMKYAELSYTLSRLDVDPDNTLHSLNMRGNYFPTLTGPFIGLNRLTSLDLSSSYVQEISETFFANLTSLESLNLDDNLLGDFFSSNNSPQIFLSLTNLRVLKMSFNYINNFPVNVFAGLDNLRVLNLCKNSLSQFAVNISHMQHLIHVDLNRNRIYNLPVSTRQHIDLLLARGLKVTFDLSHCQISCECENFEFLIWMTRSGAFDPKFTDYNCIYEDNVSRQITDGYNLTIQNMRRKCASDKPLLLSVTASMCVLFCVILSSVLYRFRWKLRYLYYAAHLFYKPSSSRNTPSSKFDYDAFISYDQKDEQFVVGKLSCELEKRGLRLCIHGRDFRAGEHIASNIVRAVCSSRKTVVVLSRHMVSSYWCGYEVQMANMEAMHTGRHVLIFLLMDPIPNSTLGTELLYHIRNNTYVPYKESLPNASSMSLFWDKLVADIRN